jgi:hypothetical protein
MNSSTPFNIRLNLSRLTIFALVSTVALFIPATSSQASTASINLGSSTSFAVLAGTYSTTGASSTIFGDIGTGAAITTGADSTHAGSLFAGAAITTGAGNKIDGNLYAGAAITTGASNVIDGSVYATNAITSGSGTTVSGLLRPDQTLQNSSFSLALSAVGAAIADASGRTAQVISSEIGGTTLGSGVYSAAASGFLTLSGVLTLDAANDPNAVFIIRSPTYISTAANSSVSLIRGAKASNVFWVTGDYISLGASAKLAGNILATEYVTLGASASVQGRIFSHTSYVLFGTSGPGLTFGVPGIGTTTSAPTPTPTPTGTDKPGTITLGTKAKGVDSIPNAELVPGRTVDARIEGIAAAPKYDPNEAFTISGVLTDESGKILKGANVRISGAGLLFNTGSLGSSLLQDYTIDEINLVTSDTGAYSVGVRSNLAGDRIVYVSSGSATNSKILTFDQAPLASASQLIIDAPENVTTSTFKVKVRLLDRFGNPIRNSPLGSLKLGYSGPGVSSSKPTRTDSNGEAEFTATIQADDRGVGTISASYDSDGSGLGSGIIVASKTVTIGQADIKFSAWSSLKPDNQVKVYVKNPIGEGKIQIKVNGKEIAWTLATSPGLIAGAALQFTGGAYYLVRTVNLTRGVKSAIEVYVDSKRLTRSAYVGK